MIRDVVEVIVRALVEQPDEVQVTESARRGGTLQIHVTCAPGDYGRVIGRGGKIANAIRAFANTLGEKEDLRVLVDIKT